MDTSNWRPTQGASGAAGDWRAQLQRQKIVNKIMDILKRYLPFTGYERLQELKKIAERVEQEIYAAATSQSEYSRKTCFMILTMETRLESPVSEPVQSNSAANAVHTSVPFDSITHTGNQNSEDWQEEVYQKINAMKDLYHLDWRASLRADSWQRIVKKMHMQQRLATASRFQQQNVIGMQERFCPQKRAKPEPSTIASLDSTAPTGNPNSRDWQEEVYQKLQVSRPTQGASSAISDSTIESGDWRAQLPADSWQITNRMHMQQRLATASRFQQQNVIGMQERFCPQKRAKPEPSSMASLDSTAPTGNPNSRDWQEEVYQKLQVSRPTQGASSAISDPTMESGDWRAQLPADSRQRITNRIMDTMKMRFPSSIQEIKKIAERLEWKMYTVAISQSDYIQKISWKLVNFETKYPMQSNSAAAAAAAAANSVKPLTSRNEL